MNYDIDALLGAENTSAIPLKNRDEKKNTAIGSGRVVHALKIGGKRYFLGELTVGWLLSLFLDAENFFENYFSEFNTKIPKMTSDQMENIIQILLADMS